MTYSTRPRRDVLQTAAMLGIAGTLASTTARAQDASPAASPEEEAVGNVLFTMAMGFATRDANMAASVYTEDAEWINAFGDTATGREEIRAKLADVFSTEEFDAGQIVGEPDGSVRILTADTAVGWTYQEIEGQVDRGGNVIPLRKNHSLAVLVKQGDDWLITAHMFMDENIVE